MHTVVLLRARMHTYYAQYAKYTLRAQYNIYTHILASIRRIILYIHACCIHTFLILARVCMY